MFTDFIAQSQRVMAVAKKPEYAEFERMLRIVLSVAFGIGLLGFIISFLFSLV
ncbi:MAG: protein translocase SEC61 complex subunit gamma [Candidatus Micrarchaeia archaeon]